MSQPKRHHFVPRSYLGRFGRDSRVLVRRRDSTETFVTNVTNVAVECGFYEITRPSGTKSAVIEALLAEIETEAIDVIRDIDEKDELPALGSREREALAAFIALQVTRTPEQRERLFFPLRILEFADGREITQTLVADYLAKVHLGFPPRASEAQAAHEFVEVALQEPSVISKEFAIQIMLGTVPELVAHILRRSWSLEIARKPRFITADTPVVMWRKPTPRDEYEGIGIGNADEVRLPLGPDRQIVLTLEPRLDAVRAVEPARVRTCNGDVAAGCHHFVLGHPDRKRLIQQLPLASRRPVIRFNTGPLYEVQPDGRRTYEGEVLHTWVPRR